MSTKLADFKTKNNNNNNKKYVTGVLCTDLLAIAQSRSSDI